MCSPSDLAQSNYVPNSRLFQKFGRETINYFAGSPLNRLSFLRSKNTYLDAALRHPSTSLLLLKDLAPLVRDSSRLAYVKLDEVKILIGENTFEKCEEDIIKEYNSSITLPLVIFLGIDENKQEGFTHGRYKGKPYFAIDATPRGTFIEEASSIIEKMKAQGLLFMEGRVDLTLNAPEAAIYALARSLVDWNIRNPFCAGCGQPTLSINAGAKRTCPPTDYALLPTSSDVPSNLIIPKIRPSCITRTTVSNISFPRTDPTVIVAVMSHTGDRVLLGRQKRWPPFLYSTLAGFIEPGESFEEAVRREVWEESGVKLGRVIIHSTQPWPYPASLMIGAISYALLDGESIHLENDPELADARWFALDEVREALRTETGDLGQEASSRYKDGNLRLPPKTTIANRLLMAAVEELQGC